MSVGEQCPVKGERNKTCLEADYNNLREKDKASHQAAAVEIN